MINVKGFFLLNFFFGVLLSGGFSQTPYVILFDEPAEYFEQSLVLGNGKMGATIFGGVESEMIYLNDATLWAGEPVDPYMNSQAFEHIPEIRKALEFGAVDILILSNNYDKKLSKELKKLAENIGSTVEIVSTETEEGKQFENLGGIGAILRFGI